VTYRDKINWIEIGVAVVLAAAIAIMITAIATA
jgi:hypothetical protein